MAKSAVDNGETGRLICRAQGSPNVSFTWKHNDLVLPTRNAVELDTSNEKYLVDLSVIDYVTYESALLIQKASSHDYGEYTCIARNNMGIDSAPIFFTRTLKPDPPLALRVINVTSNTVTLKWVPGFDGGMPQSFQIRFKPSDHTSYFYADAYPTNATEFTISQLAPETEYVFAVMAYNALGQSDFTTDVVKAVTAKGMNM